MLTNILKENQDNLFNNIYLKAIRCDSVDYKNSYF